MSDNIRLRDQTGAYTSGKSFISQNTAASSVTERSAASLKKEETTFDGYMKCTVNTAEGNSGVLYWGKGIIASVGGLGGTVNVIYHESSTEDDPVVLVWGMDSRGKKYKEILHLNDIDVSHATPAEMIALNAHLSKTGDKDVASAGPGALWNSLGMGNDANSKMDFKQHYKTISPCNS